MTESLDDYTVVQDLKLSVGEVEMKPEDGVSFVIPVTIIEFEGYNGRVAKIAIPMNNDVGRSFDTGELFIQLRIMWLEWRDSQRSASSQAEPAEPDKVPPKNPEKGVDTG